MKLLIVKSENEIKIGNIKQVANYISVHPNTISRWISEGDRKVLKNGFEIYLKAEKL